MVSDDEGLRPERQTDPKDQQHPANTVLAQLTQSGSVCVFSSVNAGVIVDVNAAVPAGTTIAGVSPARLHDTRAAGSRAAAGSVTEVRVAGRGGVSNDAATAVLNVTVMDAAAPGYVTVFPCGSRLPDASNLNYGTGDTVPNAVVAKLGTNASVCIYTSADAGLLVDVNGYAI